VVLQAWVQDGTNDVQRWICSAFVFAFDLKVEDEWERKVARIG
jgi:hypothetical protein